MKNKKAQFGWIILAVIGIFVMFGVGYLIKYLWLTPKTVTTQIDSASEIIEKTYDSDNAIYNYEWFRTQYEKILANRNQVDSMIMQIDEFKIVYGSDAKEWDDTTKEEYNRLNAVKIGLINMEELLVADYNARSKMANRGIFKDKLPMNVDKILW